MRRRCRPVRSSIRRAARPARPSPVAPLAGTSSSSNTPIAIAFTSGLPEYASSKTASPPIVGRPSALPYDAMPRTTPSNRKRLRFVDVRGPKRSGSMTAIGRAPSEMMSRTMPPTPVAAPWNGSTADGWLCDSILNATRDAGARPRTHTGAAHPAPRPGAATTVGRVRSCCATTCTSSAPTTSPRTSRARCVTGRVRWSA